MKEGLLVQYFGVYAPPPSVADARQGRTRRPASSSAYTVVAAVDRDRGRRRPERRRASDRQRRAGSPASIRSRGTAYDTEGTWHWNVKATDDQSRTSIADQIVPVRPHALGAQGAEVVERRRLKVRFTLSRPARVTLQIETSSGRLVVTNPPASSSTPASSRSLGRPTHRPGSPQRRRLIRCSRDGGELGRDDRARHAHLSRCEVKVHSVTSLPRPLRRPCSVRADGDRCGLSRVQRARDAVRRRARLGRADAPARCLRVAHDGHRRVRRDRPRRDDRLPARLTGRLGDRLLRRPPVRRALRVAGSTSTTARLARAERWFRRWEEWAVFVGRITPVVRSFVSIPAGVFKAPLLRYTVLTAIGSAIWAFAWAGAGWGLGASWTAVHHAFSYVDYAVVAGIVAAGGVLVHTSPSLDYHGSSCPDSSR